MVYAILTSNQQPNCGMGIVEALYSTVNKAKKGLDSMLDSEILCYCDECEMIEGEDYEYNQEDMVLSLSDEQWWWVESYEVDVND